MFKFTIVFILFATFASSALAQPRIGDWDFLLENDGTSREKRLASTPAQPFAGGAPAAVLALSRPSPQSPMDLMVSVTASEEEKKCKYGDWEVSIDSADIPITSFAVSPTSAILVAGWSISEDDLWTPFREGLKLVVRASQKCDGLFGDKKFLTLTFSLRGSAAAYKFVLNQPDK
jgi:hypothetical protein